MVEQITNIFSNMQIGADVKKITDDVSGKTRR